MFSQVANVRNGYRRPTIFGDLIDQIADTIRISTAKKRRWLAYHLRDIAGDVQSYRLRKPIRKPSELVKAFEQTVNTCDRLLKRLASEPEGVTVQVVNVTLQPFRRLLLWELAADRDGVDPSRALERLPI